jgi:hypothetical protein
VDAIASSHGRSAGAGPRAGGGADAWFELPASHADLMRDT